MTEEARSLLTLLGLIFTAAIVVVLVIAGIGFYSLRRDDDERM